MKINTILNCASPNCAVPSKNSTSLNNSQPLLNKSCCGDSVQFGNKQKQVSELVYGAVPEGMSYRELLKFIQNTAEQLKSNPSRVN